MNYEKRLVDHLKDSSSRIGYNTFITVPFIKTEAGTKFFCWNRSNAGEAENFVTAYAKALNRHYFGGSRRVPESFSDWLPMVAFPEHRKVDGTNTFLHYHIFALFPDDWLDELTEFTQTWWHRKGLNRLQSPINVRTKLIYDLDNLALYPIKNNEDGFTFGRAVVRGQ